MGDIDLLCRTVDSAYVRDLELQVQQLTDAVKLKELDATTVVKHLKDHNRERVLALYLILEAAHRALTSMEATTENVNKVATAIRKAMSAMDKEN